MKAAERLARLLNRINQREPQRDDDLLLLARAYEEALNRAVRSDPDGLREADELALATAIHETFHYGPPTLTCMTKHRQKAKKLRAALSDRDA